MASIFSKATAALTGQSNTSANHEDGDSLITVLKTGEDRSALTILIADCTEAMRQVIVDAFDAKETGKKEDLVAKDESKGKEDELTTGSEEDPADQKQMQGKDVADLKQKQEKDLAQREKELNAESMQELRTAALKHFDDWRSAVMQRVGEVVNSREVADEQKRHAAPKQEIVDHEQQMAPPMKFPDLPKYDEEVQRSITELFPPVRNSLKSLLEAKRALILHSVLLLLLSLENYQAHSRILLLRLSTSLHLPIEFLATDESKVARVLLTAAESMNADQETKKAAEENKSGRKWKVGLATVAGAALIGITGGLAAPLLAAGIGTVMGGLGLGATAAAGYLGTLAASSVLVGGLFGAYGGRMTGKMMDSYAREVEDFAFVPIRDHHKPRKIEKEYRRLRVAIGISGWLTNQDEVLEPWKVLGAQLESFALRFEMESLLALGNAMTTMITSAAWSYAKVEIIKRTLFGALTAGLWPLALLKVGRVIDNPFSVANYRAVKAGEVLADALINKAQGERPVTLVGYSLGGKVIYSCLQKLADRKAFGLIESAVMIGTPAPSNSADWRMIRSVVAGRVVNVYSTNDYILGFLYRSQSVALGIAGLQAVENVKGVENVDVSEFVSGHTAYRFLTGRILRLIGFEDLDIQGMQEEEEALRLQEAKDEIERERAESETAGNDGQVSSRGDKTEVSDEYVDNLEKQIEKKNEQNYIGWAQEKLVATGTSASQALQKAKAQWSQRTARRPVISADLQNDEAAADAKEADIPRALPERPKDA
ncbi:hypothetical protein DOTSEDRAFT_68674 [Dothistroma septosporum NZE10]|uniref:DUF726-domain-containing protein n=1 Tax=Dothistroma septosporum (strain NZE10 / CBS 128990) TaxID=675120 RepID=N1Q2E6_DOTSN|nr:hypothetical protein DOTSEDRAFT_68674 [Dothistroma septosporum NZE10]